MTVPDVSLEPVRRALVDAAHADAEHTVAAADEDAARLLERAEADVRAIRQAARARGDAEGRRDAAANTRHARRQAQSTVLQARNEAYSQLRDHVLTRLAELRTGPEYPDLLRRLTDQAHALLGPEARVVEAADGGVVGTAEGRRIELTLPVLADRALDALGADLEGLWEP